ncbi:glycosyltransferase [Robiginitomaculum antarcticum]|uniref:glycosyltransferase n=1 Tax=Robiginitomaculum antarcticum TaxID=437507 RepID=UPI0012EA9693|nr:glycosyltransferase [Robiginitomaculum antarcticum]
MRQTKSLMNQGHEVEIVGIVTNDAPGTRAISDEGIPITRVQWRAESYVETAKIYARRLMVGVLILLGMIAGTILLTTLIVPRTLQNVIEILMPVWSQEIPKVGYQFIAIGLVGLFLIGLLLAIRTARKILSRFGRLGELSKMRRVAENYSALEEGYKPEPKNLRERILGLLGNPQQLSFRSSVKVRAKNMFARLEEFKPDIVYCHEVMTLPVGTAAKKKFGCKVIYDAHECYDDLAHAEPYILATYAELHAKHLRSVDLLIAVNQHILDYYIETYEMNAHFLVLPNTVFRDDGKPYDGRLHDKASLSSDNRILLYQGGFGKNRGLESIVESGYLLPENWFLVMMGWGNMKEELLALSDDFKAQLRTDMADKLLSERKKSPDYVKRIERAMEHITRNNEQASQDNIFDSVSVSVETQAETSGLAGKTREQTLRAYAAQKLIDEGLKNPSNDAINDVVASILRMEGQIEQAAGLKAIVGTTDTFEGGDIKMAREIVRREILREINMELEQMESRGELDKVRFIKPAPHDELVEWTKGADIGIVPYLNTGLNHWLCSPNKLFEYPNAGVPIIASRMKFLAEVIGRTNIGWTIPSDFTPSDVSLCVKRVTDEALATKSEACAEFMDTNDYKTYEPDLIEGVRKLLAGERFVLGPDGKPQVAGMTIASLGSPHNNSHTA